MPVNQLEKLRPCGRLEAYSTARHHLGFYNSVGLTATYTTPSASNSSLEDAIYAALHHVVEQHPNLSVVPVDEHKSPPDVYFARLSEIDLRTCVEFHARKTKFPQNDEADAELDELLRTQHSRNFKGDVPSRPCWSLIITSSPSTPNIFTASWFFHHAISDGGSSPLFHQSFLEGLNNPTLHRNTPNPIVQPPSTALLPPLEALHPMPITWPFFLRTVASSLFPSYFSTRPTNLWSGAPITPLTDPPARAHITSIVFSAKTTTAFASACRAEKTSLTAALTVLLASALSHTIAPAHTLEIDIPISLRPVLDIPADKMVNAISNCTASFPSPPGSASATQATPYTFSWPEARRVKTTLATAVAQNGANNPVALLKYVSDFQAYFRKQIGMPRVCSAEVSSLGVWRSPSVSSPSPSPSHTPSSQSVSTLPAAKLDERVPTWVLGRLIFSQCLYHSGPPVNVSVVTGGDGCLVLSFTWREGEEEGVGRVPGLVREGVERLVAEAAQG